MKIKIIALFLSLAAAGALQAQATRTWVSGVGDDANPCSRTAPCKTFAGAISKTAAGGEQVASVLVSGTNGIIINAGAADRVVLKNIQFEGLGTGINGINFLAGVSLTVQHCSIRKFTGSGINFQPAVRANLIVTDSVFDSNTAAGVTVATAASGGGVNRATIADSTFTLNGIGLKVGSNSDVSSKNNSCSNNAAGGEEAAGPGALLTILNNSVSNNQAFGVHAGVNAIVRLSNSEISFNNGTGLLANAGGQILSLGNNLVAGNVPDGAPTGVSTPH